MSVVWHAALEGAGESLKESAGGLHVDRQDHEECIPTIERGLFRLEKRASIWGTENSCGKEAAGDLCLVWREWV